MHLSDQICTSIALSHCVLSFTVNKHFQIEKRSDLIWWVHAADSNLLMLLYNEDDDIVGTHWLEWWALLQHNASECRVTIDCRIQRDIALLISCYDTTADKPQICSYPLGCLSLLGGPLFLGDPETGKNTNQTDLALLRVHHHFITSWWKFLNATNQWQRRGTSGTESKTPWKYHCVSQSFAE